MTDWIYRIDIVVAAANVDQANALAVAITGNSADSTTFSIPLSELGQSPATHFGATLLITELWRAAMEQTIEAPSCPPLTFYRTDTAKGWLQATNSVTALTHINREWTFQSTLGDTGLKIVQSQGGLS